ncbi:flagellar motor switch protein FliM [Mariprofundus sp. EBB-1]|uniref:flagellar motor switch protein FliM n=1 Tax=Mariprofundus sp. EBB-1 TaxID=2650971 RepID=UPI000EF1B1E0|nr:FliM/FliN family flagellar motor switch protein [Mariprofundus sp. EBB-1]RLL51086.1 flagellar motor switch protein FliM [Mariprofundus sp. EBB-1]
MSEPILAPEEIEALMAKIDPSEQTEAMFASLPPMPQPEQVDLYSFSGVDEDSPERYPMFVNLQERLVEMLDENWDEIFNRDISVNLEKLESSIYKELITVDHPQVYFVYEVEGSGRMMVTFDTAMIVAYVDAMLGGDGEAPSKPEVLSPVEMRLSERIADKLGQTLCALWAPVFPLDFKVFKIDHDPQFLAMTGAMEKCFSSYFNIKVNDELTCQMGVHYPHAFLEPMFEILRVAVSDEPTNTDHEWSDNLLEEISKTSANVCFEMGRCQIDIGAFLALKSGDFLPLTTRANDPCSLWVEDIPLFHARAGEKDGSLAAEILDPINNGGQS